MDPKSTLRLMRINVKGSRERIIPSPIFLESLSHGSGDGSPPWEDCIRSPFLYGEPTTLLPLMFLKSRSGVVDFIFLEARNPNEPICCVGCQSWWTSYKKVSTPTRRKMGLKLGKVRREREL